MDAKLYPNGDGTYSIELDGMDVSSHVARAWTCPSCRQAR